MGSRTCLNCFKGEELACSLLWLSGQERILQKEECDSLYGVCRSDLNSFTLITTKLLNYYLSFLVPKVDLCVRVCV